MGAFADALGNGGVDAERPRVVIYPSDGQSKAGPFQAALDARSEVPTKPEDAPASFSDRFGSTPDDGFAWSRAITDIPHEIGKAAGHAIEGITNLSKRGEQGPLEGLATTGRAIMSVPELIASPITGAARSMIGHTMTNAEHAAGTVIAPQVAAKDDPTAMYEASKEDTDRAMSAMGGQKVPLATKAVAVPTIEELKHAAVQGFHSPEVNNLVLKPEALKEYSQGAQIKLDDLGLDDSVAPVTHRLLMKMQNAPNNAIVTGRNIVSTRRGLQNAAKSSDPSERAAAVEAIEHLDEYLPGAGKHVISGDLDRATSTLETARANYSAAAHAETIDNKTIQAELRAAAANSGMNVSNTIRQRMADILLKPKERRGFTQDQLDQMETIVRGTHTQNALRVAGNIAGGGGGLGTAVVGGIGAVATPGGVGGLIPVAGFALKALSNRMTLTQAAKLSESIRSSAPLASSAQKLQQANVAMGQSRNAKTVAGVVMASRNFSNNLRGIGISIAPNDIARTLLQSQAGTEPQQQNGVPRPVGQ